MSEEVDEESSKKLKYPSWNERINRDHTITPKIRRFILLFVSKGEGKTAADFAKYFKVNPGTIATWLSYPQVKQEIERLLKDNEARVMSLLESRQEEIVRGLLKMFENEKLNPEVRRKIGYNLLSFGRLKDVNTGRTVITQQQAIVSPYENMSDEDIEKGLAELDELENG